MAQGNSLKRDIRTFEVRRQDIDIRDWLNNLPPYIGFSEYIRDLIRRDMGMPSEPKVRPTISLSGTVEKEAEVSIENLEDNLAKTLGF